MGNFNYLGKDWSNIVFEGRNKLYGAYKLRQENVKNTALALVFGIGGLGLLFGSSSYLYAANSNNTSKTNDDGIICTYPIIEVDMTDTEKPKDKSKDNPILEDKKEIKKEVSSARTDVQENIKFTETKIVDANKNTETLASQDMFNDNTNSGFNNSDADTNTGRLKTDGSATGLSTSGTEGTDTNNPASSTTIDKVDDKPYSFVQHKAEPKEGFERFYSNFAKKFTSQELTTSANEIVVKVKFVVEKDGSFTDIQIIDDKHGVGKEAERILKNMPKWKAAEHNGKKVRSMFTLPIKIQLR